MPSFEAVRRVSGSRGVSAAAYSLGRNRNLPRRFTSFSSISSSSSSSLQSFLVIPTHIGNLLHTGMAHRAPVTRAAAAAAASQPPHPMQIQSRPLSHSVPSNPHILQHLHQQQQQQFQAQQSASSTHPPSSNQPVIILPRVYANVLSTKPASYSDYETYSPTWNASDDYAIVRKIGRGKYSEVFEGVQSSTDESIVIKVLKPVKKKKIRREIKILEILRGGPNIVPLVDTVKDAHARYFSLVFPYYNNLDFKVLFPTFQTNDCRFYLYQLLRGLNYAHSCGIIHRDIKPHNLVIDHQQRQLYIIDWGLAEFYHPTRDLNVRVASRYFKPPELLMNYKYYDYSLDLWSVGCVMAGLIFQTHPFFDGRNNDDQLVKIVKVLGTAVFHQYKQKYAIHLDSIFDELIPAHCPRIPFEHFIHAGNQHLVDQSALDLLNKLLVFDHADRLTCLEAMAHPYFDPIRSLVVEMEAREAEKAQSLQKQQDANMKTSPNNASLSTSSNTSSSSSSGSRASKPSLKRVADDDMQSPTLDSDASMNVL